MRLAGALLWGPTPDVAALPPSDWRPAKAPGSMWLLAHCAGAGFGPAGRRARSLVA